jgi:5-methylcytosine-specific restriction endonuclease McrA
MTEKPQYEIEYLLAKNLKLIEFLEWFKPNTKKEEDMIQAELEKYRQIQRQLKELDLNGSIPKLKIPPVLSAKKSTSNTSYEHRISTMKTFQLLEENSRLLNILNTFDLRDIGSIVTDEYPKFKIIQRQLTFRGVPCEQLKLNAKNKNRIKLLLGNECSECGTRKEITMHHIKAKTDGGTDKIQNLKLLCRD